MAAKDCLWLFDFYALFLGFSIFVYERCKFLVYFNYFCKSTQMILSLLGAVLSFKTICHSLTPLYELNNGVFFVGHLIFNMLMHIQGNRICRQFNDEFTRMEQSQKRRMKIVSSCLTTVSILIHIWMIFVNAILESKPSHSWQNYLLFLSLQVNGDFYIPSLIWISLLILSSYYECQNCLNNIEQKLTPGTERDATVPDFVLSTAMMMKQSVSAVNMFSGFPLFVTISYIFIGFSGVLSLLRSNIKAVLIHRISECGYVAAYCLAVTALLVMVTVLRHKLESRRSALIFRLSLQNQEYLTINWKIGLKTLCHPKLFEFSVMDLFPLDLNLILKFAASHITFTILMMQLESSV